MDERSGGGANVSTRRDRALVAGLALAAQANALANGILYDDRVLVENPVLRAPFAWPGVWASTWWGPAKPAAGLYRPVASWSLSFQGWLHERFGLAFESVVPFHAVNALVHAVASVLVLAFLRALGIARGAALAGACLFAVLALHVEALAPITGRSETLALAFGLGYVLLHVRRGPAWAATACYAAAVACKESAVGFLGVALLVDAFVRGDRPAWGRHVASVAALLAFLAARAFVLRDDRAATSMLDNPLVAATTWERVLTALAVQGDYLLHMLVPLGFRSDASHAALDVVTSLGDARVLGVLAVAVGGVVWAARAWRRQRAVALALAGYALLFAPASNLLFPIGTPRAERLAYAPSLFVCGLAGLAIVGFAARFERRGRALASWVSIGVVGALVTANLAASWARNAVWRDPATFFRAQVAEAPRSAKARFNLGAELAAEGDDAGAEREYEEALRILPDYPEALHNLGNLLRRRGEPARALELYRRALELQPEFLPAAFGIVGGLHELHRDDEARAMLAQIAQRAPNHPWLAAHEALLAKPR